jgi:hypothetical protein
LILAGSSDVGTQFALFAKIEYRQSDDEPDAHGAIRGGGFIERGGSGHRLKLDGLRSGCALVCWAPVTATPPSKVAVYNDC